MTNEELAKEYERIADEIEAEKPEYARVLREDAMRCRGYDGHNRRPNRRKESCPCEKIRHSR